jgi:predicted ribosome quality control (RQC) complex YloA/Tae2 family protein
VKEYPAPAGGCLLTETVFSRRLKDLIFFDPRFTRRDIELLKCGRNLRISEKAKIVVGRDQRGNEMIRSLIRSGDTVFTVAAFPGPTVLATGDLSSEEIKLAASITVAYSDAPENRSVAVHVVQNGKQWSVSTNGMGKSDLRRFTI